jgi:succinate dehydrogenase hydrophobic anchor subunit
MRDYTTKEKAKIIVGALTSLVIVGWAVVLAIVLLSLR